MREFTAGSMTVLGVLLVLAGGAVVVLRALSAPSGADTTTEVAPAGARARVVRAVRDMPAADRLILWGIVLLVLAAIAAGAIGIEVKATANSL
jgi:hypothetical protein